MASPQEPSLMDWASYYPAYVIQDEADASAIEGRSDNELLANKKLSKDVEVADIGCGFGGLLVALAPQLPNTLILGMLYGCTGLTET